ncbi:MAG: hypothetical protein GY856_36250 [bacterium]|nr:hypothetical protein [bacterium]
MAWGVGDGPPRHHAAPAAPNFNTPDDQGSLNERLVARATMVRAISPRTEQTALSSGVVTTDAQGHAINVLTIADAEPTTAYVAVLVDVLDQTELITFQIEG